jgi:simple sugar transport system ATP-binding protein
MQEIVRMVDILKVYPNGILANQEVNFSIVEGEIHALVGENGAGKSTLMKILFGIEQPTEGKIVLNGQEVKFSNPQEAIKHGIGMVHQHFMLVPSLTVAENVVLGDEPKKAGGLLDIQKAIADTAEIAKRYHFDIDPKAKVEDCSVGTKQKIEILKALFHGAKVLILDEPTAVLTPQETSELFKELMLLKDKGHTIVFISHKLNEVKEITDRITIMRAGKDVGTYDTDKVSKEDISNLMVGREIVWDLDKSKADPKDVAVQVEEVTLINEHKRKLLNDVSFSIRRGEILGVVGVEGNGQRELVDVLTGLQQASLGTITINGENIQRYSIRKIRDLGLSHIPEDRMTLGVAEYASIEENLLSIYFDKPEFLNGPFMKLKQINAWAKEKVVDYRVKTGSEKTPVKMLSGGNIQKVVVAREFSNNPKVIIADQPTRGIDVGAAQFIHKKLIELRDKGCAVLLVSADLTEVMDLSDSLVVFYNGKIVAYFEDASILTETELGLYMLGLKMQSEAEIRRCVYA